MCKCDQKCALYDECCPNAEKTSAAGASDGKSGVIHDNKAWEDEYIQYMTCTTVRGTRYGLVGGTNATIYASYHLISKCPAHVLPDSVYRNHCENPAVSEDIFTTPVAVRGIGHFKNIYCALCQGVSLTRIYPWHRNWRCDGMGPSLQISSLSSSDTQFDVTFEELVSGGLLPCKAILNPPSNIPDDVVPRPCFRVDVKTCQGDYLNGRLTQMKCPSYLAPVKQNGTIYQNLHCAHCSGIDVCRDYLQLCNSVDYGSKDGATPGGTPFVQYFIFASDDQVQAAMSCGQNEAFDPITSTCQVLFCFSGSKYNTTTEKCERVLVNQNGRVFLSFFYGQTDSQ